MQRLLCLHRSLQAATGLRHPLKQLARRQQLLQLQQQLVQLQPPQPAIQPQQPSIQPQQPQPPPQQQQPRPQRLQTQDGAAPARRTVIAISGDRAAAGVHISIRRQATIAQIGRPARPAETARTALARRRSMENLAGRTGALRLDRCASQPTP